MPPQAQGNAAPAIGPEDVMVGLAAVGTLIVAAMNLRQRGGGWEIVGYMLLLLALYWIVGTELGRRFFLYIGGLPEQLQEIQQEGLQ